MKKVKEACICQTIVFTSREEQAVIPETVREEYEN